MFESNRLFVQRHGSTRAYHPVVVHVTTVTLFRFCRNVMSAEPAERRGYTTLRGSEHCPAATCSGAAVDYVRWLPKPLFSLMMMMMMMIGGLRRLLGRHLRAAARFYDSWSMRGAGVH